MISKEFKSGKELTAYLEKLMSDLTDSIVQDPAEVDKFVRLWDSNLGMHEYSINNIVLAYYQFPKLSMIAGFRKWQSLGRTIIKGSKSIKILAPLKRKIKDKETEEEAWVLSGFRYVNVFDVAQTEGENLDFGHPEMVTGDISFDKIKQISPLPVVVEYAGTSNGNVTPERILVSPKDNEAAMVATLIHEIAHYKLGHIGSDLDREIKEQESEVVSYIVTSYLGLENQKSIFYVGAWNGNHQKLRGRGKRLLNIAEGIIRDLENIS